MRDPKRIKEVTAALEECWSEFPDLRFGQLMTAIWMSYGNETELDPFNVGDDVWLEWIQRYKEDFKDKYIWK